MFKQNQDKCLSGNFYHIYHIEKDIRPVDMASFIFKHGHFIRVTTLMLEFLAENRPIPGNVVVTGVIFLPNGHFLSSPY